MVVFNLFTVIVLVPIVISLSQKDYPFLKTEINDEKHAVAFNKLLNSIVKVNQKRLEAIKRLNKLQATDLNPTLMEENLRTDTTRRDSDESDSDSSEKNVIYLVIPETPPNASQDPTGPIVPSNGQNTSNPNLVSSQRIRKQQPQPQPSRIFVPKPEQSNANGYSEIKGPNQTISQINISRDGLDALRQSIERSCRSREVKKCKNACKAAAKSACATYDCRKKLKKKFKKECNRECKAEFKGSW